MTFAIILSALWLGVLTSISPCPLATNIAAISFISKDIEHPLKTFFLGFLYTLGRVFSYVILAIIILKGVLEIPETARFFQEYMNLILGPVLIVVGVILLGLIKLNFNSGVSSDFAHKVAKEAGVLGSIFLGVIFALSFCPVSAALFFGSLIPICIEQQSGIFLPLLYGVGTGLPVMIFALVVAFSVNSVGKFYHKLASFEVWMRRITGVVFIFVGIHYSVVHILGWL